MSNLTYLKPNGEWGIEGVNLSVLPPKVYGALCKLKDIEHKDYLAKVVRDAAREVPATRWQEETCRGCGREHNCRAKGCAVLRRAADIIEEVRDR